ncbi:APC family permease [Frigoribacterium sp. 2-23]|uniref:APC family permease n=1 Tax=Frigoribacterium sp. 2-23 TaxID=3415006 RepID=UPI003C6FF4F4
MTNDVRSPKRWLIGDPLPSEKLEGQLLPKHLALPIFASDPLSSVAYAPQELLMILLIGGLGFLTLAPWVATAVVVLLIVVVVSYRQLIKAYPSGGGDYEVAHKNLGEKAGLVVASALLVDYVMTVAVSVASGVDNIISAVPELAPARVELAVFFVILLAAVNLRGVRESSKAFAIPTYLFVASVFVMIVIALVRTALGDPPVAESAQYSVRADDLSHAAFVLLLLRAFSSGCSALTGVEAISNGVPAFRRPKVKNAQRTLVLMGSIAIVLFVGLTAVALISKVHYAEVPCHLIGWEQCATQPQRSLIAQIASAVFGTSLFGIPFYLIQACTAAVLLLAANTAFNGFPLLGSILARDEYAPKALNTRGDRLIYSNGVIVLALVACAIMIVYRANVTQLIQLYIIGVFVSFTLGQTGMVKHWWGLLKNGCSDRGAVWRGLVINLVGALMTLSVLVVVTITKFTHGAWLVFVIMPILFVLMLGVNRYYRDVQVEIEPDSTTQFGARGDHAIVLVGRMQKPVLKALDYAIAARHDSLEAIHVGIDDDATALLQRQWADQNIEVPLRIVPSPYRDISVPLIKYIKGHREEHGAEVVTVYTPIFIVGHWWEGLLHNHKSRRIRQKLMLVHGVTVALVPWLLDSSEVLYGRRSRPIPGQDRRGEPIRPIMRRPHDPHGLVSNGHGPSGLPGAAVAGGAVGLAEPGTRGGAGAPVSPADLDGASAPHDSTASAHQGGAAGSAAGSTPGSKKSRRKAARQARSSARNGATGGNRPQK